MSEFREDVVSGDWIIVAPERAKRPHEFLKKRVKRVPADRATCPFENLEKSGNWPPILSWPNEKTWRNVVVPNKYPALKHEKLCVFSIPKGPYHYFEGAGHHDLLISRDHKKTLADLTVTEGTELLQLLQKRYLMLAGDKCLLYASTFFNWGESVGASLYHPHYQILTLPIIPPDILHSLTGSQKYFKTHRRCVHCDMLAFERRAKSRVVAAVKGAVAIAPYVSRQPFEIRIYPTAHTPFFEKTSEASLRAVVAVLRATLRKMRSGLRDPDLNFFIHTAPLKQQEKYGYYHWHIEVLPKITIPGGFELSTGIDINVIDPDRAARLLRKAQS